MDPFLAAIDSYLKKSNPSQLSRHAAEMSLRYREARENPSKSQALFLKEENDYQAYLAVRAPATYAACLAAVSKFKERVENSIDNLGSVLDVGGGPGTALWALAQHFHWKKATILECDKNWSSIGTSFLGSQPTFEYRVAKVENEKLNPCSYDTVIASYSLNEWQNKQEILERLWLATKKWLILIEPGRSDCFAVLETFRSQRLAAKDCRIIAPCTGHGNCPLKPLAKSQSPSDHPSSYSPGHLPGHSWCHFSARLDRSRLHRKAKGAQLGFEDEKYTYLVLEKTEGEPLNPKEGSFRVMESPRVRAGHIRLALCNSHQISESVIAKSEGEIYKRAKQIDRGDLWTPSI